MTDAPDDESIHSHKFVVQRFDGPEEFHLDPRARVDEWLVRLDQLRQMVEEWVQADASEGFSVHPARPVKMLEELMIKFHVPEAEMPAFTVRSGSRELAFFRPNALWVVGANGRVDIITPTSAPMLVDTSQPFTRPVRWVLYGGRATAQGAMFTRSRLVDLLHEQ
jgi:hypothetical protein